MLLFRNTQLLLDMGYHNRLLYCANYNILYLYDQLRLTTKLFNILVKLLLLFKNPWGSVKISCAFH